MICTDQLGHSFELNQTPNRIISIVPSQSEFLWELGLNTELVGITKFCIHPDEMFRSIKRVGGTKQLDLEKIRRLKPDLIIGNKEENEKADIDILKKEFNVWMSDIYTFEDSFRMMLLLGKICDRQNESEKIVTQIRDSIKRIQNIFLQNKALYFIWNKPYMVAAKNTFIDHVLTHLGIQNVAPSLRYPEVSVEELKKINPEYFFLSSEPFPFKDKHINELQAILPGAKILIVDGEVFSWYGTRLLHLEKYVAELKAQLMSH